MSNPRRRRSRSTKSQGLLPFQIVIGFTTAGIGGIVAVLGQLREDLGFSEASVGVIVSAGFLAAFIAQITLASQADRGHARTMVVIGIVLSIIALLVMVVADDVISWSASRALFGFGSGLTLPGLRRAATVLDPERVGENLGRLIVGEVGGFLIGPIAAGVLAEIGGLRLPFAVFAVVLGLFLPFCARLPADRGQLDTSGRRMSFDLLKKRRLQGALVLIAGYFVLLGAFESVIPVMYRDRGASTLMTGLVFSTFAIPILFVSPLAGRVADRVGAARVASLGVIGVSVGAAFYGVLPGYIWPAIVMGIGGFADGFGFTACQVAVSRAVSEQRQAGALGLMGATEVLAAGIAAAPAAILYQKVGAELAWPIIAAITIAIVGLAQLLFRGTTPVNQSQPEPARL